MFMMATRSPAYDLTKCATCSISIGDKALMTCARCHSVMYCTKDCQKKDRKSHKKRCGNLANAYHSSASALLDPSNAASAPTNASSSNTTSANTPINPDAEPFISIQNNTYLHNRAAEKTFRVLIDCLRMRQENISNHEQVNIEGTIYAGLPNSEPAFRDLVAKAKPLLPLWWTNESLEACLQYSRESEHFGLDVNQEKKQIQSRWDDNLMPMKLRLLGDKIYGHGPGGADGDAALSMQVRREQDGRMVGSHIDASALFGRR